MNLTLIVAVLGGLVTAIGWLVTHILSTSEEKRRQILNAQIEFTKQQLEELYGPLAFLALEGEQSFHDMLEQIGRNFVFYMDDPVSEEDLAIWLFWVENDFFPRHQKVMELLTSKTHLIEGESIPESFIAYLNHYHSWKINHERWHKQNVPYSWHSKVNYPKNFSNEVLSTFNKLMKRHSILIGKIAESKNPLLTFRKKSSINY